MREFLNRGVSTTLGLIIIITVAALATGGIFAYQKFWAPKETDNVIKVQNDETAGWKTYVNTKYYYQIKVPQDFYNKAKPDGWIDNSADDSIWFSRGHQWYAMIDYPSYGFPSDIETRLENSNFKIGGIPAVKIYEKGRPQAYNANRIYFKIGGKLFLITTLADIDDENNINAENVEKICNQILSTFELIKPTDKAVTANWKTYANHQYGFELKYPDDFVPTVDNYSKEFVWLKRKSQPEISEPFIAIGQEKYTLLFQGTWTPVPYSQAGNAKIISSENVIINDILFSKDLWSIMHGIDNVISYNTNHNGKYYTIYRDTSSPDDAVILDQILSTFKFIEPQGQVIYTNSQYGFSLILPISWKGYSVLNEAWNGFLVNDSSQKFQGLKVIIRNPNWTEANPWQDIPVMVFTKDEWTQVEAENLSVSAAPIPPSKLGENQNYVFALPPRWVGFTDALGQDEAVNITKTFKIINN